MPVIALISAFIAAAVLFWISRRREEKPAELILKGAVIIYLCLSFFRYFLNDAFIWVINGNYYAGTYYDKTDVLQSLIRWGYYTSFVVYPMAVFSRSRFFRNMAVYFCLPFALLSMVFFQDFMAYFADPAGRGLKWAFEARAAYFTAELSFAAFIPLGLAAGLSHRMRLREKGELARFAALIPLVLLQMMPAYLLQSFFGYSGANISPLSLGHVLWLAVTAAQIIALYYVFRFKSYTVRYRLCVFLALVLFFHYGSTYLMGVYVTRLPIQLCNLASYIILVAVLTRWRPLYNFIFVANIVGTCIALAVPDISGGLFSFWNIHFLYEHMLVLIVPVMCMNLRIFPRVRRDAVKHTAVGFCCYFMFCLVLGTLMNGYTDVLGTKVNYFYMFDLDKALSYLPFLGFLRLSVLQVGRFTLYPLFQGLLFTVFLSLCMGFYALVQRFYEVADDHARLRLARIELYQKLTGRESASPTGYAD